MKRILIVDDEAPIRELLTAYFEKRGYEVKSEATGSDGMNAARESVWDVIILDVVLSDADGMDVLEKLKSERPAVPVIVMTGIGFDEPLLTEAKQKGASAYVSKTLPLNTLLAEVENLIRQQKS